MARSLATSKSFKPPDVQKIQEAATKEYGEDLGRVLKDTFLSIYEDLQFLAKVENVASLPTADSSLRGKMMLLKGGVGVADGLRICRKNAADAYEWFTIF